MNEDIWGGVEPIGNRPVGNRTKFLSGLIGVIVIEWILWLAYRYLTFPIIESAFSRSGFIFHIFAAPIIGLTPLLLYWRFYAREKGLPWKFTRKNLFSSVIVGAISAVSLMLLYQGANWLILVISGYGDPSQTLLISLWRSSDVDWFILMTFTFFFIVGPVEELQYRSFLQDQIGRAFKPSTGVLIASILFALSHLPIYFIVYKLDPIQVLFTLCWTFTMGSVLGIFYFQSRNIMGPIIMHGLWDWILSVYVLDISVKDVYFEIGYLQQVLWLVALVPMALLTIVFINVFYVAIWKKERPEGSFGSGPVPLINDLIAKMGCWLKNIWIGKAMLFIDSSRFSLIQKARRSVIGVVVICSMVMLFSFPGITIDLSGNNISSSGGIDEGIVLEVTVSFDAGYYIEEGKEISVELDLNDTSIISKVSVSIVWTEQNEPRPWMINDPDQFSIGIFRVNEELVMDSSYVGSISLSWSNETSNMTAKELRISASCIEAGDIHPANFDILGLRRQEDNGNDVTISVQITYFEKEQLPGKE